MQKLFMTQQIKDGYPAASFANHFTTRKVRASPGLVKRASHNQEKFQVFTKTQGSDMSEQVTCFKNVMPHVLITNAHFYKQTDRFDWE